MRSISISDEYNGNTKQRRGAFLTFAVLRESVVVFASVLREGAINICRGRWQLIIPCLPRYYLLPDWGRDVPFSLPSSDVKYWPLWLKMLNLWTPEIFKQRVSTHRFDVTLSTYGWMGSFGVQVKIFLMNKLIHFLNWGGGRISPIPLPWTEASITCSICSLET